MDRSDRGEIAFVGEIGPLADVDRPDQLGDQEIQIGIALAVRVGAHVDRHAVDRDGEIGAVVEIEAAQEILVGLAVAAVLGDDQAGHDFKRFGGPGKRPRVDIRAADIFLACRRDRCCRRRSACCGRSGHSACGRRWASDRGAIRSSAAVRAVFRLEDGRSDAAEAPPPLPVEASSGLASCADALGCSRNPTSQPDRAQAAASIDASPPPPAATT